MHTNSDGVVAPHSYIHISISAAQAGQIQERSIAETVTLDITTYFSTIARRRLEALFTLAA